MLKTKMLMFGIFVILCFIRIKLNFPSDEQVVSIWNCFWSWNLWVLKIFIIWLSLIVVLSAIFHMRCQQGKMWRPGLKK